MIQQLLSEAGNANVAAGLVAVSASGAEAAADMNEVQSPETYIGYERAAHFVSPGGAIRDTPRVYVTGSPRLNEWGLSGDWTIGGEHAVLNQKDGLSVPRTRPAPGARRSAGRRAVRFRVTIDGAPPGDSHGTDVDADGQGVVTGQRLYQLVRQKGTIADHTFEIRFLDSGVHVYAFTFG